MIRAFLSFVEEDLNLVNIFRSDAKSDNRDLEFVDYPLKEPFASSRADQIARRLARQLKRANLTICLYGPTTHTNKWVDWELRKSLELGTPIMGVSLYDDGSGARYPPALEGKPRLGWNARQVVRTARRLARK